MTPSQKIIHLILLLLAEWKRESLPEVDAENIEALFDRAKEEDDGSLRDAINEIRASGVETHLPVPHSRNYEARAVARQYVDGSWIGWTYWYGGGKHGAPQDVVWIEYAYDVSATEEPKTVIVRTFEKVAA